MGLSPGVPRALKGKNF